MRRALSGIAVLVTVLALAACEEAMTAASAAPADAAADVPPMVKPDWSPPAWLHGDWEYAQDMDSITVMADAYSVKISLTASGAGSMTFDAEDGVEYYESSPGIYLVTFDTSFDSTSQAVTFVFERISSRRVDAAVEVFQDGVVAAVLGPLPLERT